MRVAVAIGALVSVAACDKTFSLQEVGAAPVITVPRCGQDGQVLELPRRRDGTLTVSGTDVDTTANALFVTSDKAAFAEFVGAPQDSYSAITLVMQVATLATSCSGGSTCEACPSSVPSAFIVDIVDPDGIVIADSPCPMASFDGLSLVCVAKSPTFTTDAISFLVSPAAGQGAIFGSSRGAVDCNGAPGPRAIATCGKPLDEVCGDGIVQMPREQCDDGNMINDDACTNNCASSGCGDGAVNAGEECDDGNSIDDDTCTNLCKKPICGDQIIQAGEECDDGNSVTTDSCVSCKAARCGDGFVQDSVEQCDDANANNSDACVSCRAARCGDKYVWSGHEECDDGNNYSHDGCDNCRKNYQF